VKNDYCLRQACVSVRMERLVKFDISGFFENLSEKFKVD
jgi:hypothetical protein